MPVADQIGTGWNGTPIGAAESIDIRVSKLTAHTAVAQERRVADDELGLGPRRRDGGAFVVVGEDRVAQLDVVEGLQHRVARVAVAVVQHPLDVADPDRDARQLLRVRVDLDPQHVVRVHPRELAGDAQPLRAPPDRLVLQVLEQSQRHVQEVARPARRVQHSHRPQPLEERAPLRLGVPLPRREPLAAAAIERERGRLLPARQLLDARLHRRELAAQRVYHHRLDDHQDLLVVRVVRAQLPALVRVQPALEQRAENRRLHPRPVEQRRVVHRAQLLGGARDHLGVVEEPAVEPLDAHVAVEAVGVAVRHAQEQLAQAAVERPGVAPARLDHLGQHALRQQPGVLGEEAEDDAVEVVGDRLRLVPALVHRLRDLGEARRGQLRDLVGRLLGPERLRLDHDRAEHAERLGGLVAAGPELVERDGEHGGPGAGEVGVDLDAVHVANDERGRVLEVLAVVEELLVRGGEVGVRALVLPPEVPALPDVGPALTARTQPLRARLERVGLAGGVGFIGRGHVQQAAEVDEVLLRGGALAARVLAPLGGERGRRGVGRRAHGPPSYRDRNGRRSLGHAVLPAALAPSHPSGPLAPVCGGEGEGEGVRSRPAPHSGADASMRRRTLTPRPLPQCGRGSRIPRGRGEGIGAC